MKLTILDKGWSREDFETRIKPIIDSMMLDRGWIINSYAQIEFLLADLIVKSRKFKEYEDISAMQLPFGIDGRVDRVKLLIERMPLSAYAKELNALMEEVLMLEETRHFFSHGFVSIHITPDGSGVGMHFRRYLPPKKGCRETKRELMVLPKDIASARERWLGFGQNAVLTFRRIYEDLGLESHDVTDGNPDVLD